MKLKIFIAAPVIALLTFIAASQIKTKPFAPAEDLPREALIYVQIADLPTFIKLLNESEISEKYAESTNFADFQNGHLGIKLASRWQEFNAAAGFPIDLETAAQLANNQAAIGIYDIGKIEFVFVAPVSDEIFAATRFIQNKNNFTEATLADGTTVYRATVEADRGRQAQELLFTNADGRFILATSEKLLTQTLDNIKGGQAKNRLIDEPAFKILSEKFTPRTATVWVNQTALNSDYYFKHYWLMSKPETLKNIRAGIFGFEIEEGKLIESRRFLLNENVAATPISMAQARATLALLPENIPFYNLRKARVETVNEAIEQTIFEPRTENEIGKRENYYAPDEGYTSENYETLGEKFDANINDVEDAETNRQQTANADFATSFQSAVPNAALTFGAPKILPAPRFAEFRRAAVFNLAAPENFNRTAFESAVERNLAARVLVSSPEIKLNWETKNENNLSWRELDLPMLGQTVDYAIRGGEMILTNDADFLREILAAGEKKSELASEKPFAELTVINLDQREEAFDQVFEQLGDETPASGFFTGNISSLLDSISEVERIEIRKNYSANIMEEELIFVLRSN
ncbi:MAG: hypothetical protein M3T96_01600 [Acidobacteriota bacterium]|nr:hypothetical protein [Acidobacteriota bacterium]